MLSSFLGISVPSILFMCVLSSLNVRIEQEMEPWMIRTFTAEWRIKWVPAIISYCRGLKKKDITAVTSSHEANSSGDF